MFCPKCGKEIPENATFCPFCGGNVKDNVAIDEQSKKAKGVSPFAMVAILMSSLDSLSLIMAFVYGLVLPDSIGSVFYWFAFAFALPSIVFGILSLTKSKKDEKSIVFPLMAVIFCGATILFSIASSSALYTYAAKIINSSVIGNSLAYFISISSMTLFLSLASTVCFAIHAFRKN